MLSYLADYYYICGPLRLFGYLTLRGIFAALTALMIGYFLGPWLIAWLQQLKLSQALRDHAEVGVLADLHAGKKDTPTMGGLLIYIAITTSVVLWATPNVYVITALVLYSGLTLIGFCDDYQKISKRNSRGLRGMYKMLLQALLVFLGFTLLMRNPESHYYMSQLWLPFIKTPVVAEVPLWALYLFFFLVISGSSNAINLTDGIDGLAIGCTVTSAMAYAIMAYAAGNILISSYLYIGYIPGVGELAIVCAAMVGASLGFLWYNCHPAELFMGDTGSLGLGGLIGAVAFMVQQPFTLIIVGGIFVLEAVSVILQVASFKTTGRRILRMAPLHHHFELKGWQETKVVIRFWIISLVFALAGLCTLKLR